MKLFLLFTLVIASFNLNAVTAQTSIDAIIAIVEDDVITERELGARKKIIRADFASSNRQLPDDETLHRQVLEVMINDSVLLQEAKRRGLRITDGQLNQAMQKISRDNKMDLSEFRLALISQGIEYEKYRESIRKELIVNALRRQFTQRSVNITDEEVDEFMNRTDDGSSQLEYKLAHILVMLPDAATPEEVTEAKRQSAEIMHKLDTGADFGQLTSEYSSGTNALNGGDLGWRKKAEIPSLFTDAVLSMQAGDHAGPFRSASGYHVVHLSEHKNTQQVLTSQFQSRHILLRPNELLDDDEIEQRLLEFRQRIIDGEDFARLARLYSVDYTSGAEGGNIGWMSKGDTVKAYEDTANQIADGKVSLPFRSQFGWHILEVTGHRTLDETDDSRRQETYSQLLEQKQREAFGVWRQRLRAEAYVVIPEAPDA